MEGIDEKTQKLVNAYCEMFLPFHEGEIRLLVYSRGKERYVFLYDENKSSTNQLINIFEEYSLNPDLSFSIFDEGVLLEKINNKGKLENRIKRLK